MSVCARHRRLVGRLTCLFGYALHCETLLRISCPYFALCNIYISKQSQAAINHLALVAETEASATHLHLLLEWRDDIMRMRKLKEFDSKKGQRDWGF